MGANLNESVQFSGPLVEGEHWPVLTVSHYDSDFHHPPAGTDVGQWIADNEIPYDAIDTESGGKGMNDEIVGMLIADSRVHARSAMRLLLAQVSDVVVVGEAADVDAAISAVGTCRPDVVLLDWELTRQSPERNRDAALDELRLASPESFVIALSGLPEARREALAVGADAFVSKGDPPEKLLAAVGSCGRISRF
jgi:CheY-like chemotaxis protein